MSPATRVALAPMRARCGGLRVTVNRTPCVLRCSGALSLPDEGALIAGDLHLEKGSAFAARGQMLPPYDSRATLDRLATEIAELSPRTVVLLGDSFHDRRALGRMAADDHARLRFLAEGRDWVWLEGNHDQAALNGFEDIGLPGRVVGAMTIATLTLVHEPKAGEQAAHVAGEVAGHLHPCARVAAYGRSVRRACFVTDGHRIILPAFGAFTGGLSVRDPAIASLFAEAPMAGLIGPDRVHAMAWDRLS
jgi:DNA ligase-associated metallophosphoesterase